MQRPLIVAQRLLAVFLLGIVLLNYPLLALFNRPDMVFGVPALFLYVFFVWLLLIVLAALIIERRRAS